jgi:hypothetical protein
VRYLPGGNEEGDASGLSVKTANQSASFQFHDHAMNGRGGDAKVALHVGLGGRSTVQQDVRMNEREILALLWAVSGSEAPRRTITRIHYRVTLSSEKRGLHLARFHGSRGRPAIHAAITKDRFRSDGATSASSLGFGVWRYPVASAALELRAS